MNDHLEDDAELYALGLTEPDRTAAIETHLASCDDCRNRVIAAEAAAGALAAALPAAPAAVATRPRSWLTSGLAAAAAVVFAAAAAFEGYSAHATGDQLAKNNTALLALASSHFAHTTLTSDPGVVAKAIYARDGSWCYIVTSGVESDSHVVVRQAGALHDLGPLSGASAASLFVRGVGRVQEVSIVDEGRVIAHGTPAY